jgi:hypothetical protein
VRQRRECAAHCERRNRGERGKRKSTEREHARRASIACTQPARWQAESTLAYPPANGAVASARQVEIWPSSSGSIH